VLNLTIRQKIISVSFAALVGFIAIFSINHFAFSSMTGNAKSIKTSYYPTLVAIKESKLYLGQLESTINLSVTINDSDILEETTGFTDNIRANFKLIENSPVKVEGLEGIVKQFELYNKESVELAKQFISGDADLNVLQKSAQKNNDTLSQLKKALDNLEVLADNQLTDSVQGIEQKAQDARWMAAAISILWVVCLFVYNWLLSKNVASSIMLITQSLTAFSDGNGDLTKRLNYKYNDELGKLADSFDKFVDQLHTIISEVVHTTSTLEDISKELIESTNIANEQNNKQNDSIQDSTTAVRELLTCVGYITQSSTSASALAQNVTTSAENGNERSIESIGFINNLLDEINATSSNVDQLKQQVGNVSGILNTIQGIAEQTNLLALNAAIEAARAGEQGRGFAVVADEVRSLAGRTHQSTVEIQTLLNELISSSNTVVSSMQQSASVTEKTVLATESTGSSLVEIKGMVHDMLLLNDQVASATEEQSVTCKLIDESINSITDMSENSLQHGEQLVVLGGSIQEASQKMYRLVNRFTV